MPSRQFELKSFSISGERLHQRHLARFMDRLEEVATSFLSEVEQEEQACHDETVADALAELSAPVPSLMPKS